MPSYPIDPPLLQDVEIDRDLSRKRVGPLALARLYGESCKEENVAVHFSKCDK